MQNPDLIPSGANQQQVEGIRWRSEVAKQTPPMSDATTKDTKYYVCTNPHASMHRPDGKKIPFVFGFCEAIVMADQEYLDNEIHGGNPYIRLATLEEITQAKMKRDPRGTILDQVRPEIEAEMAAKYEDKIEQLRNLVTKLGGDSSSIEEMPETENVPYIQDTKLQGIDAVRAALAAKKVVSAGDAKIIMGSIVTPLKGIVSSSDIAVGAKDSN